MGMRCTQHMGLSERALEFLKGEMVLAYTEQVTRVYPDGRTKRQPDREIFVSTVKKEPSGEVYHGMFEGEEYRLYKYTHPDKRVYYERVQAVPWSSGPVIFLALQDEAGNWVPESQWPRKEILAA